MAIEGALDERVSQHEMDILSQQYICVKDN